MAEVSLKERLELGIAVLDSAIAQVITLGPDSLTKEWLKELNARKRILVGQLQLIALEMTDSLAQITEDDK